MAKSLTSTNEMTETLRLAATAKADQGYHETEVSFGGEADLHQSFIMCMKNPNHKMFIPVKKFNIEHLPAEYRDRDIVDLIRAKADLTCRLSVTHISANRPQYYSGNNKHFPYHSQRGRSDMLMTGTGWVDKVRKLTEKLQVNCECKECVELPATERKKEWGKIYFRTAAHVVCDDTEAAHTSCDFFYDDSSIDINSTLRIRGPAIVNCDIKGDSCLMAFVTHDLELLNRFYQMYCHCREVHKKVYEKYKRPYGSRFASESREPYFLHSLAVCVSHPHGCSKQVTIGEVTERQMIESGEEYDGRLVTEDIRYTYNTPTCPGSSGALVFIPGCRNEFSEWYFPGLYHPHSEGHPGNRNISAIMDETF